MESSTKKLLIATGIIGICAALYFILTRDKDGFKEDKSKRKSFPCKDGTIVSMGYLQNGYIHIAGDDRAKATPVLKVGAKVNIMGANDDMNGERTVEKIWKDTNGNVGAFKTKEFTIGYNTSKDTTYEDKAYICIKK
jgi:hypothetical protein